MNLHVCFQMALRFEFLAAIWTIALVIVSYFVRFHMRSQNADKLEFLLANWTLELTDGQMSANVGLESASGFEPIKAQVALEVALIGMTA
jgi:hypothetical protein